MCIAIYSPPVSEDGVAPLTRNELEVCRRNNPDGMGMAWVSDGKIHLYKTLNNLDGLMERYEEAIEADSPVVMHFRIKTHGDVELVNCHPFEVPNHRMVLAHNGIIPFCSDDKKENDTQLFIRRVLNQLPKGWETNPGMVRLIEEAIGNSKLVILRTDGFARVFNEQKGVWDNGVWFSNTSYSAKKKAKVVKSTIIPDEYWEEWFEERAKEHKRKHQVQAAVNGTYFEGDAYDECHEGCWVGDEVVCYGCLGNDDEDLGTLYNGMLPVRCSRCHYLVGSETSPHVTAKRNAGIV